METDQCINQRGNADATRKFYLAPIRILLIKAIRRFVCAMPTTHVQKGKARAFRSYESTKSGSHASATIWEAARATTALPGLFEPIEIGVDGMKESFSGWLGCTNPLGGLMQEAEATFGSDRMVSFLLSVGAGQEPTISVESSSPSQPLNTLNDALLKLSQGADAVSERMEAKVGHLNLFLRFNIPHRSSPENYNRIVSLGTIKTDTTAYLSSAAVERRLDRTVEHLRWRNGITTLANISKPSSLRLAVADNEKDRVQVMKTQCKPLPPVAVDFIARPAIQKKMRDTFFDAAGRVKTGKQNRFVSYGPGGSGKTQVSTKFCHDHRDRYAVNRPHPSKTPWLTLL